MALCWTACFEEAFTTSPDVRLVFTTDTLRFDTVFTELGTATRSFRVHNPADLAVRTSVRLPDASVFRMNVDGLPGPVVNDVEIGANDSIWIFVEATIDPDQPLSVSPFVIEEQLEFMTNGALQKVLLEAWGQNANYVPSRFHGNRISVLTCDLGTITWDDPKPYVIYGTLLLDSCTLVWPAGARIYVHGGLANNTLGIYNDGILFTLPRGRIRSEGTADQPVVVQDDRLEPEYTSLWGGIRLGPASGPHVMRHTIVRHAATAVVVDSAAVLEADAVQFHSNAGSGLFARHATVSAVNGLFYDNGGPAVTLTYGGQYAFDYCTMASFGNDGEGLALTNFYCPEPLCQSGIFVNNLSATFRNCIIVGSAGDEILLSDATRDQPDELFNVSFEQCIVKVNELLDPDAYPDFFTSLCTGCLEWSFSDTLFANQVEFDFHLDTLSLAEEMAIPIPGVDVDLDGVMRDAERPDIGCYERVNE